MKKLLLYALLLCLISPLGAAQVETKTFTTASSNATRSCITVDPDFINSWTGGTVTFYLDAGVTNAARPFVILGTMSGCKPGTPLPDGTVVPINWDMVTNILLGHPQLWGVLDTNGQAIAPWTLPPFSIPSDVDLCFAFIMPPPPAWWASPHCVHVTLKSQGPCYYVYDDGSSETLLGHTGGGELCWMHGFDAGPGDLLDNICPAWGSPSSPGFSPPNGTPAMLYVWNDPTNDYDPIDAVLLATKATTVMNVDTDIINCIYLDVPIPVSGVFFVGCSLNHAPGQYVAPMDGPHPSYVPGRAWVAYDTSGVFNPIIGLNSSVEEMGSIGYPHYFLLRARSL